MVDCSSDAAETSLMPLFNWLKLSLIVCNDWLIVPTASFVCCESFRISSATTLNPLPASPERAASIAAFKPNKFV